MTGADLFDAEVLNEMKKEHLVKLVLELQNEKKLLVEQKDSLTEVKDRVIALERSHLMYLQYGRRESVEITGIRKEFK